MGGGTLEVPDYFLNVQTYTYIAGSKYGRREIRADSLRVRTVPINTSVQTSNGSTIHNPLWSPYEIRYSGGQSESLAFSAYVLCAGAASNEPIE